MQCITLMIGLLFAANFISTATSNIQSCQCSPEVDKFREYITINTSPGQNLNPAVDFWRRLAAEQGIEIKVYECEPGYPLIVLKWPGIDPSLSSVLLLSHMDVEPANYKDGWDYPPFSAHINDDCEVVGRGTLNMKSIAIQYYEAMNRIQQNTTLLRDVYMIITPDKTSGSLNGIALFVKTEEFKEINVGVTLDVGIPTPTSEIQIVNQDKTQCIIQLDCYGEPIQSAFLPDIKTTAADPCGRFFVALTQYREEQYRLSLESEDSSEYTATNLIGVKGVTPYRIVPSHFRYFYIAYLAHNTSIADFNRTVRGWVPEDENVKISVYYEATRSATTKADNTNPYWVAIEEAFKELNITVRPSTIPTTTDAKFIVDASIPTFGISPQRFTMPLIGGVNERLSITVFNEGIRIYQKIIPRLANLPKDEIAEDPATYLIQPTII